MAFRVEAAGGPCCALVYVSQIASKSWYRMESRTKVGIRGRGLGLLVSDSVQSCIHYGRRGAMPDHATTAEMTVSAIRGASRPRLDVILAF